MNIAMAVPKVGSFSVGLRNRDGIITDEALQRAMDCTVKELEALRYAHGGGFRSRRFKVVKHKNAWRSWWERVQLDMWGEIRHNIITNEGLAYDLDVAVGAATQITAWYLALSETNTTPLATHTYASPGYTEANASDLDEATRPAWTAGSVSGTTTASIDNTASPATFTGDQTFTAYGCGLVGGGTAATTLADTAGGGTLRASGLFSAGRAMDVDVQLEVDYTFTHTNA